MNKRQSFEAGRKAFEQEHAVIPPRDVDGDVYVAGWLTARDEYEQRQFAAYKRETEMIMTPHDTLSERAGK
jgi:hypothetical protein